MATSPQTPEQQKAQEQKQKAEQERKEREQRAGSRPAGSVVSAGAASTYNMAGGASSDQIPLTDPRGDRFLTRDEIKELAGDTLPGEVGWLKLDENGTPVEPVTKDNPFQVAEEPEKFARVIGAPQHQYDEIVTPSGAPVTKFMNPDPALWDEGMLARNPIPEETEQQKKFKAPLGAPVVNQPVTV